MKKNNLLIDATIVGRRRTGIERYAKEVTLEIIKQHSDSGFGGKITILIGGTGRSVYDAIMCCRKDAGLTCILSPFDSYILTHFIWIPIMILTHRPNTIFFPGFPPSPLVALLKAKTKVIRTIFDAVMWKRPETTSLKNKLYYRPLETIGAIYYTTVHAISQHSKSELESVFPSLAHKIIVSGCGVSTYKSRIPAPPCLINQKYLLFVGTLEPRKNLLFLLQVFKRVLLLNPSLKLVMVGRAGWGSRDVLMKLVELGLEHNVIILNDITDEQLPSIYEGAEILVFPSIYEGFGLPIVEAMSLGLPVISSNTSSMPEVCGDAAVLLPPDELDSWVDAIINLLGTRHIALSLRSLGKKQSMLFSWERVAKKIIESIRT